MSGTQRFYWTKYWSTYGVLYGDGWETSSGWPGAYFRYVKGVHQHGVLGRDLFATEDEARSRVEDLRRKKIKSLQAQLRKVETLTISFITEGGEA